MCICFVFAKSMYLLWNLPFFKMVPPQTNFWLNKQVFISIVLWLGDDAPHAILSQKCILWERGLVKLPQPWGVSCLLNSFLLLLLLSHFSDPIDGSPPGSPVPGILQGRTLEWVAMSFSNAWKWKVKVKSLSRVRLLGPLGLQPTRLLHPWDFPGKSTGVGCHCFLLIAF